MDPTTGTHILRVMLADDHALVREGLRTVLGRQSDMRVVAEADGGMEALRMAQRLRPDVLVLDVAMPDLDGFEVTRRLCDPTAGDGASPLRVLALSIHSDCRYVQRMFDVGASGYLTKDCALDELAQAIRTVARGDVYLARALADADRAAGDDGTPTEEVARQANALSRREREVLIAVARGQTSREVADALGLSVRTVETHRRNIGEKLGLHGVAELTRYALRQRLVEPA